jgi:precorrin-2 dehydrogenase
LQGPPETSAEVTRTYYPAFLNLKGRKCVVVGGGAVAARKVSVLRRSGGKVTVISPTLTDSLMKQKEKGLIIHVGRNYRKRDLSGAFVVVAATSDGLVNRRIAQEAPCLVNVVDRPGLGNFIVPSQVRRGPLTIAVSTSGASPALSRQIRCELEGLYGSDFGHFVSFVAKVREKVMSEVSERAVRERLLKRIVSPEMLGVIRRRGVAAAKEDAMRFLSEATFAPKVRSPRRPGLRRAS